MMTNDVEQPTGRRSNAMTRKISPDEFLASQLYQSPGRVLLVDFDDLLRQFGKAVANRMLDALAPDPSAPRAWIVKDYVARERVSLALVKDGLYALGRLIGLGVAGAWASRPYAARAKRSPWKCWRACTTSRSRPRLGAISASIWLKASLRW
jgi:hypothetical protein